MQYKGHILQILILFGNGMDRFLTVVRLPGASTLKGWALGAIH